MPTVKHRIAFDAVVKGSTLKGAMLKAGYSPTTANRTNKLTATQGWQELMDTYLPDSELAKKHKAFLNSDREEIGVKALDMAYKARGNYAPEKNLNLNVEVAPDKSIEDLADSIENLRANAISEGE